MTKAIDITGQRFGRLTAIAFVSRTPQKSYWRYRCDCGNEITELRSKVQGKRIRSCQSFQCKVAALNMPAQPAAPVGRIEWPPKSKIFSKT